MSATSVQGEQPAISSRRQLVGSHADCEIKKTAARHRSRRTASNPLNFNSLLIFAKVAEASSFSEGARRLRIPVSTASRQVADLEEQLGVRLLERSTRSLKLTDIGAEVFAEAHATIDIGESILGLVSSRSACVSGLLRIVTPPSVASFLITPLVGAFQASYPDVRVHMTMSDRADFAAGDFELLIKVGPMKDSSRLSRKILTFRDRLLASPSYLQRHKAPETPDELLGHRLIALSSCEPKFEWIFVDDRHRNQTILTIDPFLSVNDPTSLVNALLADMGIGNLPSVAIGELVQKGLLIELLPQWRFPTLDVSVIHASSRHVPRPVQEFIRFAAKWAPTLLPDRATHKREDSSAFDALGHVVGRDIAGIAV
jgi:DNA-binding transcriptional LysR family regulator